MGYGFWKWHREVQPVLDRTAKAQAEITELQLEKLQHEVEAIRRTEAERTALLKAKTEAESQKPTTS